MTDSLLNKKQAVRAQLRCQRNEFVQALPEVTHQLAFSKAPSPIAAMFNPGMTLAGYIPLGSEADPRRFMSEAEAAGCSLALPHVISKSQPMRFLSWQTNAVLIKGPMRLLQPHESSAPTNPDIVFVPLLGFDRACNRIGQGAGHYDRALSIMPHALRIGIAWSVQEMDAIPTDPWDEPLHAICTEKEWIVR